MKLLLAGGAVGKHIRISADQWEGDQRISISDLN